MPRDREKVRRRLQEAALRLYGEQGYERTTTADIAGLAGVTERTFFRHFADKREVLFDGEAAFGAVLADAVRGAPSRLRPWAALQCAFAAVEPILIENRDLAGMRRAAVAGSAALRERELAKTMALTRDLAAVLRERGTSERLAMLAAQIGMAAFGRAFTCWLDVGGGLATHLADTFADARALILDADVPAREASAAPTPLPVSGRLPQPRGP